MSSLETRKIEPATGTTVTLGASGDTVLVSADQLKTNTVKDAGGNTLFTSNGAGTLSSINAGLKGGLVFISSQTAPAGTSSISFTSGIDSTYDEYVFYLMHIHCTADGASGFLVNFSTDGGSNYNAVKTTTFFGANHWENDSSYSFAYEASHDLAQSTSGQRYPPDPGDEADESIVGDLHLFGPSSTTYVKHFYGTTQHIGSSTYAGNAFIAGYLNTTSAINAVQWAPSSETFSGTIYLYGVR